MEYIKANNDFIVRLDKGDEVISSIKNLAEKEKINFASISGIGAVNLVEAGFFDTANQKYCSNTYTGDLEITALSGNISTMNNEVYLHFHISIANEDGNVFGGHLNKAVISATGEITIHQIEAKIDRCFNEEVGLNTIKFN